MRGAFIGGVQSNTNDLAVRADLSHQMIVEIQSVKYIKVSRQTALSRG